MVLKELEKKKNPKKETSEKILNGNEIYNVEI